MIYPKLKGKTDYVLYGPAETPYASFHPALRETFKLKRGAVSDWQGVLSQKVPRFDNRAPAGCALIPRLHVCRADDPLVPQVTFLLGLKNLRYTTEGQQHQLSPEELKAFYDEAVVKAEKTRLKAMDEAASDAECRVARKKNPSQSV